MSVFVYHENHSGMDSFRITGNSYLIDEKNLIFSLADSPLRALTRYFRKYPQEFLGNRTAESFCNSCSSLSKEFLASGEFGEAQMKEVLSFANNQIGLINSTLGRDPKDLESYDLAETSGVTAVISNGALYYGLLEDCYINILRGNKYEDILNLDYQIINSYGYMDSMISKSSYKKSLTEDFRSRVPESFWYEPFWCCNLRNNSDILDSKGKLVGWGSFDGEPSAEDFFQVGRVNLEIGDHIIMFTESMTPFIERDDCFKWFIENVKPTFEFEKELRQLIIDVSETSKEKNSEKTLIYFKWEG